MLKICQLYLFSNHPIPKKETETRSLEKPKVEIQSPVEKTKVEVQIQVEKPKLKSKRSLKTDPVSPCPNP
jgi:hypothetical protein